MPQDPPPSIRADIYRGLHLLEFVGNHDVPRIASRLREQPAHFHLAMASLILAARGMPCMYYGDEWGLEGWGTKDGGRPEDLDLRPPAPEWRDEHQEAKARSIGMMTALRTQHRQLFSTGTCTVVANTQEQIALLRSPIDGRGPSALLLFNCADEGVESFPEEAMHHRCGNMTFWRHLCFTNGAQVHGGAQASFHEGRLHVEGGLPPNSVAVFISELY